MAIRQRACRRDVGCRAPEVVTSRIYAPHQISVLVRTLSAGESIQEWLIDHDLDSAMDVNMLRSWCAGQVLVLVS